MHDVDGDERRFAPSKAMVWTDNGGPILLFDQDRGSYHSLNKQASEMWRMIADGANRTQIVAALASSYEAPEGVLAADVADFLDSATASGLIVVRA